MGRKSKAKMPRRGRRRNAGLVRKQQSHTKRKTRKSTKQLKRSGKQKKRQSVTKLEKTKLQSSRTMGNGIESGTNQKSAQGSRNKRPALRTIDFSAFGFSESLIRHCPKQLQNRRSFEYMTPSNDLSREENRGLFSAKAKYLPTWYPNEPFASAHSIVGYASPLREDYGLMRL